MAKKRVKSVSVSKSAASAAAKVLRNPNSSKSAKTKAGYALSQRAQKTAPKKVRSKKR